MEIGVNDFVISDSGVKVWRTPESHPLLKQSDTTHPAFQGKLSETYSRGKVKGLPRICSLNSEDARTWHYFSPLLSDNQRKARKLKLLLGLAFPESLSARALESVQRAGLEFWPKANPPPSRPLREGQSEPDLLITLGEQAVVLVEAKYRSGVSEKTTYDKTRDQVIRLLDVGSWYAKKRECDSSYVIVLQYGDARTNAEQVIGRYAGNPEAIEKALHYREDLSEADFQRLSRSVAFVRWPNPLDADE